MLKALKPDESMEFEMNPQWLSAFHEGKVTIPDNMDMTLPPLIPYADFKRRFVSLLSYEFASMPPALALSILSYKPNAVLGDPVSPNEPLAKLSEVKPEIDLQFSRFDIKRLASYANNLVDYHVILDLLPSVAKYYFLGKFRSVRRDDEDNNEMNSDPSATNTGTHRNLRIYV